MLKRRLVLLIFVRRVGDDGSQTVKVDPVPEIALDVDRPVVAIDNPFRQAQAQAGAFGRRRSGGIHPDRNARRYAGSASGEMPTPVSRTSSLARSPSRATRTRRTAARRRELDGVVEQVEQQPFEPAGVARDRTACATTHSQASRSWACATGSSCSRDAAAERAEIDRLAGERNFARLGARQRQELIRSGVSACRSLRSGWPRSSAARRSLPGAAGPARSRRAARPAACAVRARARS